MISFIKSAKYYDEYPLSNKEIVFIGKSNVGKSSLINSLYGKVAYVGKTPGKTRLLNFFNVNNKYTVCDVPGYGYAKRNEQELIDFGKMMDTYFSKREALKLCILILDIRHNPTSDDLNMIEYLKENKKRFVVVANKSDKLSYSQKLSALNNISEIINIKKDNIYDVSCTKKTNIDVLRECIENI